MEFIIDFYKGLETLDLIIFWGIIIVIILLFIFSLIMINKNKKLKNIVARNAKESQMSNQHQELPIKKEEITNHNINEKDLVPQEDLTTDNQEKLSSIDLPELPGLKKEQNNHQESMNQPIEIEKKFIAEEHIMEYNKDLFSLPNIKKNNAVTETKTIESIKPKATIDLPSAPYQRNVLREMSLGQTSPIGLTTPKQKENQKMELAKDLSEALHSETTDQAIPPKTPLSSTNRSDFLKREEINKPPLFEEKKNDHLQDRKILPENHQTQPDLEKKQYQKENDLIKKELSSIEDSSPRKTEIRNEYIASNQIANRRTTQENNSTTRVTYASQNTNQEDSQTSKKNSDNQITIEETKKKIDSFKINQSSELENKPETYYNDKKNYFEEQKHQEKEIVKNKEEIFQRDIDPHVKELLNSVSKPVESTTKNNSSEKYLEEVSRKLAESEITDEVERTDYELEQEENAIISYKELMEKKDSIQTIDEEDAVISIEELMDRSNQKITTQEPLKQKENTKLYKLTDEEEDDDFINELKQFRNDL